ncbi:DUF898 family protein [Geobacter sp.]|uniref:DUF898 family protein n=1 Tax=Geobacter sp. TaxID=46610 RepID=UPI0026216E2A|nr:DUF898 family protein [Geobacter sp.]
MERVSCPHCQFAKELPAGTIPEGARVTCPRCGGTFTFTRNAGTVPAGEGAPAGSTIPSPSVPEPAAAPRRPPSPRTLRFSFEGTAREYFGIWIVNTLLKVVTCGVYSAWAKVRKRRWFYGNTMLHGAPFDYLADPLALFRGWLIGAAALILYSVGSRYSPSLASLLGLLFFLAMPWLVVRSRLFNARNSTYRNVRFNFRPDYREAYVVFAGLYLLLPFTLGFLFPYVVYRQQKFLAEQSDFGTTPFSFEATAKDFYLLYLKAAGWFVAIAAAAVALMALVMPAFLSGMTGGMPRKAAALAGIAFSLSFPLIYFFIAIYVQTRQRNLVWSRVRLGENRFASTLRAREMAWLYFSNAFAILCTFGLLVPWATVRLTRYRFENLTVSSRNELEGFVAASAVEVSAAGEEIGDLFGIDVAL